MKIFIDIETIPNRSVRDQKMCDIFNKKYNKDNKREDDGATVYKETAGLYPEFGKIVCISMAMVRDGEVSALKSFSGDDEKNILQNFCEFIGPGSHTRVGHNVKSFDLPFIVKRLWINGIKIPKSLNFEGLKPWEVMVEDTMEMRRGLGQYTNNTSLQLICLCLGLTDPKANGDGSNVEELAKQGRYTDIMTYCEGDVEATIQVYKKIHFIS